MKTRPKARLAEGLAEAVSAYAVYQVVPMRMLI
jgi:hypothetical protein